MKVAILVLFSFFFASSAFSQQNFFVYIQTDNKQPFYVKLDNKVYSSSASGYAIIPKLQRGDYTFSVGFPKNEYPLQNIVLTVNEDAGYLLKNFGEKGWGFFNIQSLSVIMAGNNKKAEIPTVTAAQIAKASDTTQTIPVVAKPSPVISKEEIVKTDSAPVNAPVQTAQLPTLPSSNLKSIAKLSSSEGPLGRTFSYVDASEDPADTITLFIAVNEQIADLPAKSQSPAKKGEKFLDIEMQNPNSTIDTSVTVQIQRGEVAPGVSSPAKSDPVLKPLTINSDCKALASNDDFLKIRKKMAAETSEERMIAAARKLFKSKCYTTEQVKNLSLLFLKDSGKYNFFDSAYPFISDTQNFGTLESQLSDPYYITRFKAMLRN